MEVKELLKEGKKIEELPLKVVFYARVSTENELQKTSIKNQIEYFENYIKKNKNWTFISSYIDEGISGKSVKNRVNFLKMMKEAKEKKFNLILTKSVSRFARNTIDSIYYTNILLKYDIGVFFLNDNINTFYSDSEFGLTLMASIAQDELRKLSESVQFGLNQSIKRGVVLGNNNILGYTKNNGKLKIIDKEATIIKEIFIKYATKKYNYSALAKYINNKYNMNIDNKRIKRILTNYKYKGYYCGRKSKIIDYKHNTRKAIEKNSWLIYKDYTHVPPIIEERLWDQVNKIILQKEKQKASLKNYNKYNQKIYCGIHNIELKYKKKKYKDKYYNYLVCPNCIHISTTILDKLFKIYIWKKIIFYKNNSQLFVKCKKD